MKIKDHVTQTPDKAFLNLRALSECIAGLFGGLAFGSDQRITTKTLHGAPKTVHAVEFA